RVDIEQLPYMSTDLMRYWMSGIRLGFSGRLSEAAAYHDRSTADTARFGRHVVSFHNIMWALIEAQRGHAARSVELLREAEQLPERHRLGFLWWGERSRSWCLASSGSTKAASLHALELARSHEQGSLARTVNVHDVVRFGHPESVADDAIAIGQAP